MTQSETSDSGVPLGYSGTKADGTEVFGCEIGSAAELAERFFLAGWRSANIRTGDRQVGAVSTRDDGARVWWGET